MKTIPPMDNASPNEKALFAAARELTNSTQRRAFLDQACASDPQMRQRLDEMLASQTEAEQFFVQGTVELALPDIADMPASEKAGDRIGRYKLLQKLGEGGCGVVYMAEQEEPIRRRVAVKVIKLGMDTKAVVARFEAERQALALMDHPNIAKVFDAGATETGRPFFVMELVRGIRITDYCDRHQLPTRERLDLFINVCHAVQHAHQKGIIHRDLKPSNILVADHDGVPVPKIIDFGIAKATVGQTLTEKTLFTAFEQFVGTPAYMSPEQAKLSGLDIDTRSDIYSLGVLLYELLTGKTPFDAKKLLEAGLDEVRRILQEVDPPRPSTRLSTLEAAEQTVVAKQRLCEAPKLAHLIRGDLDWIVMKTLEKDRNRRYGSAEDLAADLKNYLADQPVSATPPSLTYRAGKLLRRRRKETAVVGLLCLALFCAIAFGLQRRRSEVLRQSAQLNQWRQQEAEVLNRVIAGIDLTKAEADAAGSTLSRLSRRVREGLGSEIDHELLARFLTRGIRLKGRGLQAADHPTLSFSAWNGVGYPVEGVAAILRPSVAVDGINAHVEGGPVYLSSGRTGGGSSGVEEVVHFENASSSPGIRTLSCLVEAQLVHSKPGDLVNTGARLADYQTIGNPIRIVLPSVDRLFLRQPPADYPLEVADEATARRIVEGLVVRPVIASVDKTDGWAFELEVAMPQVSAQFPIALRVDLVEIAGIPVQVLACGLIIDDHNSATMSEGVGVQSGGYSINIGASTIVYKAKILLPNLKLFRAQGESPMARVSVRSSREVAWKVESLEHFLVVPELLKVVPIEFSDAPSTPALK